MGLLANRGIDPGVIALMKDNGGAFGENGIALIILLLLFGGRGGFGNDCGGNVAKESTLVNASNYGQLMDAINTNGTRQEMAIQNLAQSFGCSADAIRGGLAQVDKQLAVSTGDIKGAIASCCCNVRQEIAQSSAKTDLELVKGFGDVKQDIQATRYLITAQGAAQDAMINDRFCSLRTEMNANFNDIKLREDQREIQQLRTLLADSKAQANKNEILAAIASRDTVAGTVNATAGTWAGTIA